MAPAITLPVVDFPVDEISAFDISEQKLLLHGLPVLSDVPPNVVLSPYSSIHPKSTLPASLTCNGAFLGFDTATEGSRHVVSLGKLKGIRFTSVFRFKLWWTTQWTGDCGSDLETETQYLILDTAGKAASEGDPGYPYLLILPILEGGFRASIQAGKEDNVDVAVESGSTLVRESVFRTCVYLHAGRDPFLMMKDAVRAVSAHLGTFRHLEEKTPPSILDKFGWCTWDGFYLTVNPEGVWNGVKEFMDGGVPLRFLILDDGWMKTAGDDGKPTEVVGDQMRCKITNIEEAERFKEYEAGKLITTTSRDASTNGEKEEEADRGLGAFVRDLKKEFKLLDDVYLWQALTGYWAGVSPDGDGKLFSSRLVEPVQSEGFLNQMEDLAVVQLVAGPIGLVPPTHIHSFFDSYHAFMVKNGITGVKVDVMQALEVFGEDYGGRVELAKAYYDALSASTRKHFGGNRVIASMEHCNDYMLLGTEQISFGRVGDDFWKADRFGDPFWIQGLHMVSCSYNSLWMGQFIHPDWDMFQTTHVKAAFHAAARAICGGPVYTSDKPGQHDFNLLKKLVLPDGTILRCSKSALPTIDSLFLGCMQDGTSILKIWNLNKYGGVIGAFNCQGGGWNRENRVNESLPHLKKVCSTTVSVTDVEWKHASPPLNPALLEEVEAFVVYLWQADKVMILKKDERIPLTLDPLEYELYTMFPLHKVSESIEFGPIGLLNMFNSGGAVESVACEEAASPSSMAKVEVRGAGQFGAYASASPKLCRVDGAEVDFSFDPADGRVVVEVPWKGPRNSILDFIF